jgi:oxygen-independent coproporphyrinogen-3 oxidase
MGYTDVHTSALLGLGVSGISETQDCYHQNDKVITVYDRRVRDGEIPTLRGHLLSPEDQRRKRKIGELMTSFGVWLDARERAAAPEALGSLLGDGLVAIVGDRLVIPPEGRPFVRNVATFFDEYLGHEQKSGPIYSTSA